MLSHDPSKIQLRDGSLSAFSSSSICSVVLLSHGPIPFKFYIEIFVL